MTNRNKLSQKLVFFFFALFLFSIGNAEKTLILGIHPYLSYPELEKRFTPLADYLTEKTGHPIIVRIGKNYDDHLKNIGENKIDIAYLGPVPYVELTQKYGKKPLLAIIETDNTTTFKGYIIARKDSPIQNIFDINPGKFAFVKEQSTMGYVYPFYLFASHHIGNTILKNSIFLGSHDNVALGVLSGNFSAGAVKEETFFSYQNKGLKTIDSTALCPEHLFITSSNLPENIISDLQNVLLNLHKSPEGKKIMTGIKSTMTQMLPVKDEDYNDLRTILKLVEKSGLKK